MRPAASAKSQRNAADRPQVGSSTQRVVLRAVVGYGGSVAVFAALAAAQPSRIASTTTNTWANSATQVVPKLDGSIGGLLRARMTSAFNLAVQQVQQVETCRSLFGSLERDGLEMLRSTRYSLAEAAVVTDACRRPNVVALTAVGSPATRVCPGFERLTQEAAAVILLHEALHHAGQREKPVHPDGLRPGEINRAVRRNCSL